MHTNNLVKIFIWMFGSITSPFELEQKRAHRSSLHKAFTLAGVGIEFQELLVWQTLPPLLLLRFESACQPSVHLANFTGAKFTKPGSPRACGDWKRGSCKKREARVKPSQHVYVHFPALYSVHMCMFTTLHFSLTPLQVQMDQTFFLE